MAESSKDNKHYKYRQEIQQASASTLPFECRLSRCPAHMIINIVLRAQVPTQPTDLKTGPLERKDAVQSFCTGRYAGLGDGGATVFVASTP